MAHHEELSELYSNARVGVMRCRIDDGIITVANRWLAAVLGYKDENELGNKVSIIDHFTRPGDFCLFVHALADGVLHDCDLPLRCLDGSTRWFSFSGQLYREKGYICGMVLDITARHQAEEALRESEAFHSSIFNNNYAIMLVIEAATGKVVDANPAACQFYGYSLEELKASSINDISNNPPREIQGILSGELNQNQTFASQHRLASGQLREVEVRCGYVKARGRDYVCAIINDVTERRIWENHLHESERRLADVIEFLPDATFAIDKEGKVIVWNKAAEELTGLPAAQILGQGEYAYSLPFYNQRRPMLVDMVINPGLRNDYSFSMLIEENNSLKAEGYCPSLGEEGAYLRGKATPLYDSHGEISGAIESLRNITLRKKAEREQRRELRKFRVLFDLAVAMTADNSLDENLALLIEKARNLLGADASFIAIKDEARQDLFMYTSTGLNTEPLKQLRLPLGKGIGGYAAASGQSIRFSNYQRHEWHCRDYEEIIRDEGLVSGIVVPVHMGRENLGILYAAKRKEHSFSDFDLETLTLLGNLAAVEISRRSTEKQLVDSRQQMADIISFLPDATFAIDIDGRVSTWNKAAEELTGVKAADIIGKDGYAPGSAFYKENRPTLADLVLQPAGETDGGYTKPRREPGSMVGENFCPGVGESGAYLWGKASCLYDSQGKIIGAIESVRDVSEHRLAEQAWQESEQRLADIIDFLPDPTLVIDREGTVVAWNRAIEDMTGVPACDMLGRDHYEYAIPFYGRRQPILIDLVMENNPEVEKDYFFIQRDNEALVAETPTPCVKGEKRFLWGKATQLYNSRGDMIGAIESIRDITQRREYEEALQDSYRRLEKILDGVVAALAATAEKRDPYTAGHQRRVSQLAVSIARNMQLNEIQVTNIHIASALHDIGKMYIPAEILSKPGELTEIERLLVKTHPQAGYDIVKSIPFAEPIAQIMFQHHERMDGSGYPNGLMGEEILLEARIIAVADVVEAMSSHRPYRPAFGLEKALQEIVRNQGTFYDAKVVKSCVEVFVEKGFTFN